MHLLKTRPLVSEEGQEGRTAAQWFCSLAASSLPRERPLPLHNLLSDNCDKASHAWLRRGSAAIARSRRGIWRPASRTLAQVTLPHAAK